MGLEPLGSAVRGGVGTVGTMPLRFIAGRILRELIGLLTLSMMALPGVAVAQDVAASLDDVAALRQSAARRGGLCHGCRWASPERHAQRGVVNRAGGHATRAGMDGSRCRCAGNRAPGFPAERHRVRHGGGRRPNRRGVRGRWKSPRRMRLRVVVRVSGRGDSAAPSAVSWTLSGTRRSTARPGRCKHPCHRSCRTGVSAHRYRSLGEPAGVDAVRRRHQSAEVPGVFFALRLVLGPPGVSRCSLSTTSLMCSRTRTRASSLGS